MGLLKTHLHLLAMESKKHPIRGQVLTLGQQSVYARLEQVEKIIRSRDVQTKTLPKDFDTRNKIPAWKGTIWDRNTNSQAALTLLGADKVVVTDVSDYENPDFLMDFNQPVDRSRYSTFDVVLDVGTLEHIFDVPTALENMIRMTKVGGEIILILPASGAIDHGFYSFSPTLLHDYFKANGFENFSCYLRAGCSTLFYNRKTRLYRYNQLGSEYLLSSFKGGTEVAFFATKTREMDSIQKPVQSRYVESDYWHKKGTNMVENGSMVQRYKKIFHKACQILRRNQNLTYLGRL